MSTCIKYNNLIDHTAELAEGAVEPVTLAEAKRHLNLQFDTEGSYEFTDDDTKITSLITSARMAIEKFTGLSLIPKVITAVIQNEKGGIDLPFGPVTEFTSLTDEDDEEIEADDYKLQGLQFKKLKSPCKAYMTAVYDAGYTPDNIPGDLKEAILHQLAFLYKNRGDQDKEYAASQTGFSESAKRLAFPYRRLTWLL